MSSFIPMVSTTPPPIDDDDDFGDFMDGGGDENSEFADFSSPKGFDDFSYPSLNPLSDTANSLDQESDNDESLNNVPALKEKADQEVEKVMANQDQENSAKSPIVKSESSIPVQMSCNGNVVEDDWFPASDDGVAPLSNNDDNNELCLTKNSDFFEASVPCNDEDKAEDETNTRQQDKFFDKEPSEDTSEQSLELKSEPIPDNNDATEISVTHVGNLPDADLERGIVGDDQFEIGLTETIPASEEYLSDDHKEDSHPTDSEETDTPCDDISLNAGHTSDSADAEDTGNDFDATSLSQPEIVSDNIYFQAQAKEQLPQESCEIEDGEACEDVTVDSCNIVERQDVQCLIQTSKNESDVVNEPLPNFRSNEDSPISRDQNLDSLDANSGNADDEDDFADFGSFDSKPPTVPDTERSSDSTDVEFNAFGSNATSTNNNDGFADFSNVDTEQLADDFGGFSTNSIDDDDDFGDFDSNSMNWAGFSDTVTKKLTLHEKVDSFVSRYAVDVNEDVDAQIPHLDEHLISDTMPKDAGSPSIGSVESAGIVWPGDLWDQLEDIDNTIALNFVWNGSHHNKYLLDALGMQTQNILFSGTKQAYYVPTYYAAALGMVDPSKGILKPMSAAEKITAMSPTEKNFPVVGEVSAEESHPEWKTIADEQTSGQGMNITGSWLDGNRTMCKQDASEIASRSLPILPSALDLDYFDNLPIATENLKFSGGTDLIDPELLEVTSAPTTEPPPPPKEPGNATISKILASIKGDSNTSTLLTTQYSQHQDDSKWVEEEHKLSVEARSVLRKLPDLSYMRSKVLIFPMNMSRMAIGEE